MRFTALLQTAEEASTPADITGRRRPGRSDQVSPHLIPLLRSPATADIPMPPSGELDTPPFGDDLMPVRGIIFGLALSVPLWAGIAGVV